MLNRNANLTDVASVWVIFLALFGYSYQVWPQAANCEAVTRPVLAEIAPNIMLRPGQQGLLFEGQALANIGLIIGDDCVAVIDVGGSYDEATALHCALREYTTTPICYIIISHHHPDHILGLAGLQAQAPKAKIIGHQKLAQALNQTGDFYLDRLAEQYQQQNQAAVPLREKIIMPDMTVAVGQPLTLDLGGRIVQITAHPRAHTNNDLSVFDPQTATLWLADLLFVEHVPSIDASAKGWLAVLDELIKQPAQRAVPGHGPVSAWPQAAQPLQHYLNTLRAETRAWLDQGGELSTAQESVGESLRPAWQLFDDYHKRNVGKVYTELEWED